jgi:DNA-binding GntR family transcriptional regulator
MKARNTGGTTKAGKAPARLARSAAAAPAAPAEAEPGTTLVDQIYARLEGKIVTLELPPGALLSEVVIAREFGVSRTPVGEALQRLAREGLVTILPRRGIVVTEISVTEQLRLLEFRREIANFIARIGARRANAAERQALRAVAKGFLEAAAKQDGAGLMAADKDFHDLFASCAHNHYAATAMGPLDALSRRFFYVHRVMGNSDDPAKLHAAIATAIADGDPEAAEAATNAMADYLEEFTRSTLDQPVALASRFAGERPVV